jgi:hypothetical protein
LEQDKEEDGFAHPAGTRPRKEPLFGGALQKMETGSDFAIGLIWRLFVQEDQIRDALNDHWHASAIGDADAEHDIYADDAVCEYPQSSERIIARVNLQALRNHNPGKPSCFNVRRILGKGELWITEYIIIYQ